MNLDHDAAASTSRSFGPSDVHLSGSFRLLARGGWLVPVIFTLATFFTSLPVYLAQLQTPCTGSACQYQQLTPGQVGVLKGMGLSLGDYAALLAALTLALVAVSLAASTVIIWRGSHDRMVLLVALMLATGGTTGVTATAPATSPWLVPDEWRHFPGRIFPKNGERIPYRLGNTLG